MHIWTPRGSFRGAVLSYSPSEQDQALGQLCWAVGALGLEPGSLRGVGTAPDTFTAQIWLLEHRAARHKAVHHCQGSWHHSSGAAEQIQELTLRWKLGAKVIKPPGKVNTSVHVCERRCLTLEQAVLVLAQSLPAQH